MKHFLLIAAISWTMIAYGQHTERNQPEAAGHAKHEPEEHQSVEKVHSLQEFFSKGHFGGHVRYNFMATQNHDQLEDHFANGIGTMLEYHTPVFKGLQIGIVSLFTYNLWSSDFGEATTAYVVPFELEMFDIPDPENKTDMDRVDELYLKYHFGKSYVMAGRIGIHSPLVNMADQRMKPFVVQGLWTEFNELKNTEIHVGWLDHVSPRGTVEWERMEDAIGLFPQGITPDGDPAEYHEHVKTRGMALGGIQVTPHPSLTFRAWDYWLENQLNTALAEINFHVPLGNWKMETGLQVLWQNGIGTREHLHDESLYIPENHQSNLWGGRLGMNNGRFNFSLNYLQIGSGGAFIFPREFGKPQFFASIARERYEGMGRFKALVLKGQIRLSEHLTSQVDIARTFAPDIREYALNKYQDISKEQVNLDLQYDFTGHLKGLTLDLFYAYKQAARTPFAEEVLFYHANLHHVNLVANVNF